MYLRLWRCVIILCIVACSKSEQSREGAENLPTQTPQIDISQSYISRGDLSELSGYGTIRLIAPRFDGADALPREGVSVLAYQELAERFVTSLGLDIKWVFVDGFDQLIPSLQKGEGDIVVTNMTVTKDRQSEIAFTRPIAQVEELVVSKKSLQLASRDDLNTVTISVPSGTAYLETLESFESEINIERVDSSASDSDLLTGLTSGVYQATVIDSDIARKLLPIYPQLDVDFVLKKHRPIAWAVRHDNPKLLQKLNEFLVSHHVSESYNQAEIRDWDTIKKSGRLRMLTLNNPASYFMWRGELMGFDYELMNKFASDNNLHLSVVIKNSIPELFSALKAGEGDVVAASITQTAERETQGILFSRPYLKVSEQIVGRQNGPNVTSIDQLTGYRIGVNPATVFYDRLNNRIGDIKGIELIQVAGATTEDLISQLADNAFDFTIADSHLVAIEKAYQQKVEANFDLTEQSPIAWGTREDQTELLEQLNAFIKKHYRGLFYNVIYKKYFKNTRKIQRYQDGRIKGDSDLSPYDELVKRYARTYKMDWRLLIAQIYQESKFDPNARSFAGAEGLMQVLPRTAKQFDIENLFEPEDNIAAGTAYMHWLEQRFPGELDFQERIYFTLAAYNAGTGHVRDARRLTKTLGLNPNKWFGNVEKAMLKLSNPEYYKKARFGYVRGSEPVAYVRKIRSRYLAYVNAADL